MTTYTTTKINPPSSSATAPSSAVMDGPLKASAIMPDNATPGVGGGGVIMTAIVAPGGTPQRQVFWYPAAPDPTGALSGENPADLIAIRLVAQEATAGS